MSVDAHVRLAAGVYPHGFPTPTASDLNFRPGANLPSLVVVYLGIQNGKVDLYNDQGSMDLVVDVEGGMADRARMESARARGRLEWS